MNKATYILIRQTLLDSSYNNVILLFIIVSYLLIVLFCGKGFCLFLFSIQVGCVSILCAYVSDGNVTLVPFNKKGFDWKGNTNFIYQTQRSVLFT